MLRNYDDVEPVILSGKLFPIRPEFVSPNPTVGEDEEVSIKQVADAIVKAVGFEGNYTVRTPFLFLGTPLGST
jgi:GDP-L-fucose synthase